MKLEEVSPQKTMLVRNEEQLVFEVPSHDWDYLKYLINNICAAEPIHLTLGTLFLGIAVTSLFGALSLPEDTIIVGYPGRLLSWAICGVFFFSSLPCILYAYMQRNAVNSSKDGAIKYIVHVEERFGNLDEISESD